MARSRHLPAAVSAALRDVARWVERLGGGGRTPGPLIAAVLRANPDYTFVLALPSGVLVRGAPGRDLLGWSTAQLQDRGPGLMAALVHPDDQPRVRAAQAAHGLLGPAEVGELRFRARNADSSWRWLNLRVTPLRRAAGRVTEVLGVVRDITDLVVVEERLSHAALHDALTGLPNRTLFTDRLEAALVRARRDHREVSVLSVDLDGFQRVNQAGGRAAGDEVLRETGRRLAANVRPEDTVARVGADEFLVLLEPWDRPYSAGRRLEHAAAGHGPPSPQGDRAIALSLAERLGAAVRPVVTSRGVPHLVTASIGVTHASPHHLEHQVPALARQVLQDADAALYRAKRLGKDRFTVFEQGMRADLAERGRIEQVLRDALSPAGLRARAGIRLTAAYQPVFDARDGSLVSFEALARLSGPGGLAVSPEVFIAVAEDCGLIAPLGARVLDLACGQLAAWRRDVPGLPALTMAVNVSAHQAQRPDLAAEVRRALAAHGLAPGDLVLELTESVLLQAGQATLDHLRVLREEGLGIAIDDFGVGYASLRYLATLPVSGVKVDRSFTAGLPDDRTSTKIVHAIAGLARDLDLSCTVEGVETAEQRAALPPDVRLQGFLTGRPQAPDHLDLASVARLGRSVVRGVEAAVSPASGRPCR